MGPGPLAMSLELRMPKAPLSTSPSLPPAFNPLRTPEDVKMNSHKVDSGIELAQSAINSSNGASNADETPHSITTEFDDEAIGSSHTDCDCPVDSEDHKADTGSIQSDECAV